MSIHRNTSTLLIPKYSTHCLSSLLLALLSVFFIGCTTLLEEAQEQMAEGNYEKAMNLYELQIQRSPNDSEAIAGLRRARENWIDNQLLRVRLLRLAGNIRQSEDLLVEIIYHEKLWQVFPTGVVFATQKDEEQYFYARQLQEIEKALGIAQPLKALHLLHRSQSVIEGALAKDTTEIRTKIASAGRQQCLREQKRVTSSDFYWGTWAQSLCDFWKAPVSKQSRPNSVQLFKGIDPKMKIDSVEEQELKEIQKSFQEGFAKSKWQDSQAKIVWQPEISGLFKETITSKPVDLSADYTVQVPYEESRVETKKPDETPLAFAVLQLLFSTPNNRREVDNGNGTVTIYETKYRSEPRVHQYTATEFHQEMGLTLKVDSVLAGRKFQRTLQETYSNSSLEHNVSFPEANVRPQTKSLLSKKDFITQAGRTLFTRISDELALAWEERFCGTGGSIPNGISESERVHRCAYGLSSRPIGFVDEWFVKNTGITFADWRTLSAK